jgi:hypothetical protein
VEVNPVNPAQPPRVSAQVKGIDFGPESKVEGIVDREDQAEPLNPILRAGALAVLTSRLQGQPLSIPINFQIPAGFVLRSVSPLDPSGWIRFVLTRG